MNWIYGIVGLFIGANLGFLVACLAMAAKRNGEEYHIDVSDLR